jgi:hypothetical protein
VEGIENGGFKVGPKWDAAKNIRIPERDAVVPLNFVQQEFFITEVTRNKIRPEQKMAKDDDLLEHKKTEGDQKAPAQQIQFAYTL